MANTAAHLVDRVLPNVPYRQWVISFPRRVRFLLAKHHRLLCSVLDKALKKIFSWQLRHARKLGVNAPMTGAVTFCQRFGSLLNLNCHFHCLIPDGVFEDDESDDVITFVPLPSPSSADVERLLVQIGRAAEKQVAHFLLNEEGEEHDLLSHEHHRSVFAPTRPVEKTDQNAGNPLSAFGYGYSLHAARTIAADEAEELERLCRYGARAPIANERLGVDEHGQVRVTLTKPYYDGRTELMFAPVEFLRKLAVLIPPPRKHLTRYHGVFGPAHRFRRRIPEVVFDELIAAPCPPTIDDDESPKREPKSQKRSSRVPWAELLRRVFAVDVLTCDACGSAMRILAFITNPAVADRILDHLGLEIPRATGPPKPTYQTHIAS